MRKAFTLVEVIIVISIFSIVSLVSVNTFLTTFRVSQQTNIQNSILDDARFIVNQISTAIQTNTIDYEEYFSHCVMNDDCPNLLYSYEKDDASDWDSITHSNFGQNYGFYNWQFFYGGVNDPDAAEDQYHGFGSLCQDATGEVHEYPNDLCVTSPLVYSQDLDTGTNPNSIRLPDEVDATAFCTETEYQEFHSIDEEIVLTPSEWNCFAPDAGKPVVYGAGEAEDKTAYYMMDELYLIDETGSRKTILASETVSNSGDKALARVEMDKFSQAQNAAGENIPLFGFTCASGYRCLNTDVTHIDKAGRYPVLGVEAPRRYDPYVYTSGENIYDDFVPISPLRVNVKSLKFLINPLEDPRRSFDEDADSTKVQPSVTIFIEIEPSSEFKSPFISKNFNLKLQTTVTSGILNEVPIVSDSE